MFGIFAVRLDTALPSTFSLSCALRGLCRPEVFAVRFLHSLPCHHSLPCSFLPLDGKEVDFFAVRMAHGNDAPHGSAFFPVVISELKDWLAGSLGLNTAVYIVGVHAL